MSLFIFILFKNNYAKTRKASGGIKKMKKIWIIVSLATIFGTCYEIVIAQETDNKMSFFVTSVNLAGAAKKGEDGVGANLGGIEGADAHCQSLAEAVGAGEQTWRAYMSTTTENARDRIGKGPWYNVYGQLMATNLEDLHEGNENITRENSFTESGGKIPGIADPGTIHDMLTGSGADGRMAVEQEGVGGIPEHKTGEPATCNDWTGGKGRARVGHFDSQHGESGTIWNSAHYSLGCSQEDIEKNASIGLFYCFAAD